MMTLGEAAEHAMRVGREARERRAHREFDAVLSKTCWSTHDVVGALRALYAHCMAKNTTPAQVLKELECEWPCEMGEQH